MYSVIFLNKTSSDLLKSYHFLFKPYLDKNLIGICNWNESGTDINTAAPDLYKLIKGKKEWRAIILNTDSLYGYKDGMIPDRKNPFDYAAIDEDPMPHESPVPIIRLCHMICGYSSVAKTYSKGYAYEEYSVEEGKRVTKKIRAEELSDEELNELSINHDDLKDIYIEDEVPQEFFEKSEEMQNKYKFSDIKPIEVSLVATRTNYDGDEKRVVLESWKDHLEMTSSLFYERNHYPSMCRFMCYDITGYDFDNGSNIFNQKQMIELWLSVLTLALNKLAASYLQAYRLYELSVSIDKSKFSESINRHLNILMAVNRFIKEQLNLKPELSFGEEEEIVKEMPVPVELESSVSSNMYINSKAIGLTYDKPINEFMFWNIEEKEKIENLYLYLKAPRRAVNKAANYLKQQADDFSKESYVLDEFQIDDVNEVKHKYEVASLKNNIGQILDKSQMKDDLQVKSKEVRKIISIRMRFSTIVIISSLVLALIVIGCIPYVAYGVKSTHKLIPYLLMTIGIAIASAIGGFVVLLIQRRRLIDAIEGFNEVMRNCVFKINTYAEGFKKYFTDVCTYMKARSIVKNVQTNDIAFTTRYSNLKTHEKSVQETMSKELEWLVAYDVKRESEYISDVASMFDSNVKPSDSNVYYLKISEDDVMIPVNKSGYSIHSPYDFVTEFHLEREDIYDEQEEEQ